MQTVDRKRFVAAGRLALVLITGMLAALMPLTDALAGQSGGQCAGADAAKGAYEQAKARCESEGTTAACQAMLAAYNRYVAFMNLGCYVGTGGAANTGGGAGGNNSGGNTGNPPPELPWKSIVLSNWSVRLAAVQDGYLPGTADTTGVVNVAYQDPAELLPTIKAAQPVTVRGVVRDANGTPVRNALVFLASGPNPVSPPTARTRADDQGRYELSFSVTDLDSLASQPLAPEPRDVDIVIRPALQVTPQEMEFPVGRESIQLFTVTNLSQETVTIRSFDVTFSGIGDASLVTEVRSGSGALTGNAATARCILAPGGYCNVEVSWIAENDTAAAEISVASDIPGLASPVVRVRTAQARTSQEVIRDYFEQLVKYLMATTPPPTPPPVGQTGSLATNPPTGNTGVPPASGAGSGAAAPQPVPTELLQSDEWIQDWASQNKGKIDRLDQQWNALVREQASKSKPVETTPGIPASIQTAAGQTAVTINIYDNHGNIKFVGSETNVTINPPPERLGPQAVQALMQRVEDAAASQPALLEHGKVLSSDVAENSSWLDYLPDPLGMWPRPMRQAADYVMEKVGNLTKPVEEGISKAVDTIFTGVCGVFTGGTQYEVRHDAASQTTTVTVFEGSVEVVPFAGSHEPLTVRAGQRVQVGPRGAGQVVEVPAAELIESADDYAGPLLGLNPVTGLRRGFPGTGSGSVTVAPAPPLTPAPASAAEPRRDPPVDPGGGLVALPPAADAEVYAYDYRNWSRANLGGSKALAVGWNPVGGEKRAYLRFDLAGVPLAAQASLRLYHAGTVGDASLRLGLYRVTGPWDEGTDVYHSGQEERTAGPGELSWAQQPDIDPRPVVVFTLPAQPGWLEVEITRLVHEWQTGTPNHGVVVKIVDDPAAAAGAVLYQFRSREFDDPELRPRLVILPARGADRRPVPPSWTAEPVPRFSTIALNERAQESVTPAELMEAVQSLSRGYGRAASDWAPESFELERSGYDQHRQMLLHRLAAEETLWWGDLTVEVEELLDFFAMQLMRTEVFFAAADVEGALDPLLYLHLLIAEGEPGETSEEDALTSRFAPDVDLAGALASDDPWVVAASLFLARRQPGEVSLQEVIDRWSRGARFWDEACTAQALLFFAAQPNPGLAAVGTDSPAAAAALAGLGTVPNAGCRLRVRSFDRYPRSEDWCPAVPARSTLHIEPGDGVVETDPARGTFMLAPGSYSVRVLNQLSYSDKVFFDCEPGREVHVTAGLTYGI